MSFSEERKKAFDFCADAAKQLITLATGIVALTITFAKDFVTNVNQGAKLWVYWAWPIYLLSIICGMFALQAMTAQLEPKTPTSQEPTIRGAAAFYSLLQIISFGLAILFTIIFAICVVDKPTNKQNDKQPVSIKVDTVFMKYDTAYLRCIKCCNCKTVKHK